jgi:uncharacterized RmlC-like cupin family protein
MAECKVIHPDGLETKVRSGSMTRQAGVSEGLVGSAGIHLAIATIPPGCASSSHYHVNCESGNLCGKRAQAVYYWVQSGK